MTKVLVCGGRTYGEYLNGAPPDAFEQERKRVKRQRQLLYDTLDTMTVDSPITMIINGGAHGADAVARAWAKRNMVDLRTEYADWKAHGKAAGPMRNQRMIERWGPDLVLAFPGGKGTADMIKRANHVGIQVIEVFE